MEIRWRVFLHGQFLAILLSFTAVSSKYLVLSGVMLPSFSNFLNYLLLVIYFTAKCGTEKARITFRSHWKWFLTLGACDVAGNYLITKAYQLTFYGSVVLLDAATIPLVMLLTAYFFGKRYTGVHVAGFLLCLLGLSGLFGADILEVRGDHESVQQNTAVGDILTVAAAGLYAVSTVLEERSIKTMDQNVVLQLFGTVGLLFSGILTASVETQTLLAAPWTWKVVGLLSLFAASMFLLYASAALFFVKADAAMYNIALLSSDVSSIFCGVLLFGEGWNALHCAASALLLVGEAVYMAAGSPRGGLKEAGKPLLGEVEKEGDPS